MEVERREAIEEGEWAADDDEVVLEQQEETEEEREKREKRGKVATELEKLGSQSGTTEQ